MAGALVKIWLLVSALSSLAIVATALGHSDWRMERRMRRRANSARAPRRRPNLARRQNS